MRFDTIVAPATPVGRSALGLIRVDGPRAAEIAESLAGGEIPQRHPAVRILRHSGEHLDEAVLTLFRGPRSYTGNDVVEISHHGSPAVASSIVEACLALGARVAEPGEFTERAVLNGRMDLVQAEGVSALIESRTATQARLALGQVEGELSRAAERIRGTLLFLVSRLEGALDFADEGYEFISRSQADELIGSVSEELGRMLASFERGRATMEGLTMVLLGRPNAGKSTLLNALTGSDRAIVTDIPGTTRDLLREQIEIAGVPVTVIDTAGVRSTEDTIEGIGIERARRAAAAADIVIYLLDASQGRRLEDEIELSALQKARLAVWTKADLATPPSNELAISAATSGGIDPLLAALEGMVRDRWGVDERAPVLVTQRQRAHIAAALEALEFAREALRNGSSEEVVLVDLYRCTSELGVLVGAIRSDDVLAEIFSSFCIGK